MHCTHTHIHTHTRTHTHAHTHMHMHIHTHTHTHTHAHMHTHAHAHAHTHIHTYTHIQYVYLCGNSGNSGNSVVIEFFFFSNLTFCTKCGKNKIDRKTYIFSFLRLDFFSSQNSKIVRNENKSESFSKAAESGDRRLVGRSRGKSVRSRGDQNTPKIHSHRTTDRRSHHCAGLCKSVRSRQIGNLSCHTSTYYIVKLKYWMFV